MNGRRFTPRATLAAIAALASLAPPAQTLAQQEAGSVYDFRLPPSSPKPSAPLQGPVDTDAPVILPPTGTPEPVITASPTARPPAPSAEAEAPVRPAPQSANPSASAVPAEPSALPSLPPRDPASPLAGDADSPAMVPPEPAADEPEALAREPGETPLWPWAAGGAALLISVALLWRRRKPAETLHEDEAAEVPVERPVLAPSAPPALARAPAPVPAPSAPIPAPRPTAAATAAILELALEPLRMSASLIFATLHYRLTLTNRGSAALGPFAIAADMISAHASISQADQLSPDIAALTELHRLPSLQPGETAELTGDIRLPLAAVTPIHSGNARLLVPLVRLRALGGEAQQRIVLGGGNFVVGEPSEVPGGKLRPFRLDLGPRTFSGVAQRKLALAA